MTATEGLIDLTTGIGVMTNTEDTPTRPIREGIKDMTNTENIITRRTSGTISDGIGNIS
jgi:hypothetical protein